MVDGKLCILVLYVDDLILIGDKKLIQACKEKLSREFEMKDMGLMHYFLVFEVWQVNGELYMGQGKRTFEILQRFHMQDREPMETPLAINWRKENDSIGEAIYATIYRHLVEYLLYMVNTRNNICFVVNQPS